MRVSAAIKAARVLEQNIALDYWLRDRCAESMPHFPLTDATRAFNAGKAAAFAEVVRRFDSAPGAEDFALHWTVEATDELFTAVSQESGGEKFSDSLLDQVIELKEERAQLKAEIDALKEEKAEISGKFIAEIVALKAERSALNAVIDTLGDQPAHILTCSEADFLQDDAGDQI